MIVNGLMTYKVFLVARRPESVAAMASLLKKLGFDVKVSISFYDAIKMIPQEMPHIIITEPLFDGGDASGIYLSIKKNKVTENIPILVRVEKKNPEIIEVLKKVKYTGFIIGKLDPRPFLTTVIKSIKSNNGSSSYIKELDLYNVEQECELSLEAHTLGQKGEQLVVRSGIKMDEKSSFLCVPSDGIHKPIVVRSPSSVSDSEGELNLFPIHRIVGPGRDWATKLPDLDKTPVGAPKSALKPILFYISNASAFEQYQAILDGYDFELIHAGTLQKVISLFKRDSNAYSLIYLDELLQDEEGIEWRRAFEAVADEDKSPVLISTTSMNMRDTACCHYVHRPCGIGAFLDKVQTLAISSQDLTESLEDSSYKGLDLSFKAKAKIIALDELGGILEMKFPIYDGSKITVLNEFLKKIWGEGKEARVLKCLPVGANEAKFQIHFSVVGKGESKEKYFSRLLDYLVPLKKKL